MGLMKLRAMQGKGRKPMTLDEIKIVLWNSTPEGFSKKQLLDCINREINMRLTVYPKRVYAGNMTVEKALEEMQMMKTIRQYLIENEPKNQFDLFA